jgi:hypothetical protein
VRQSDTIAQLAAALAGAQAEMRSIAKDRTNPHFKNRYATLDAIMDTVRPVLAAHGLSVVQGVGETEGEARGVTVETMLLHKSGEWVGSSVFMPLAKADPQSVGSAMTYGRRYGVSALLALATDEDDDGNAGSTPNGRQQQRRPSSEPVAPGMTAGNGDAPTDKQRAFLANLMKSSVFTDSERRKVEANVTSKARAKSAIEWAQAEIEKRKGEEVEELDGSAPILEDVAA